LLGRVPHGNIAARTFAKNMGGVFEYQLKNGWVKDHELIPADIYSFKVQEWMRDAPGLEEVGKGFNLKLEEEYKGLGAIFPVLEDAVRARYTGAMVEMLNGGQPYKAVVLYNRWAKVAGYPEVSVVSTPPTLLDINEALLLFKDNDFRVVSCR